MMSKVFVDTNVLVYAVDGHDAKKRDRSQAALRRLGKNSSGVISTQVLQEFYVAATRRLGIDPITAKGILHGYEDFEVVVVDRRLIGEAIDCSVLNKLSFWDALIIVTAESAGCEKLWTEDLNPGQTINGIFIENPFVS
jgi:predicted nucleic acid-binding protein